MTPSEAAAKYEAEWPALKAGKDAAVARGDAKEAKRWRQALSALSVKYAARNELWKPAPPPPPEPDLETRVRELEEFARAVIRYAGNAGDDYLADKARAVLDQSAETPYP